MGQVGIHTVKSELSVNDRILLHLRFKTGFAAGFKICFVGVIWQNSKAYTSWTGQDSCNDVVWGSTTLRVVVV